MEYSHRITLIIPGKPIAKKRPRFARRGNFVMTYNDQQTEEGLFLWHVQQQLRNHVIIQRETPISLKCDFIMPHPSGMSAKKRAATIMHVKKPDTDNMLKFVKDCLNGFMWADDSQVCEVEARKFYGQEIGTMIEIRW